MTKRALILEDTAQVSDLLSSKLRELAKRHQSQIDVDVITTQRATKALNRHLTPAEYDIILLDYYAPDGNFHVLDFDKIDANKAIAISSMTAKNQLAQMHGISCSIAKYNPLTDEKANEIINGAEYILYTNS